MRTTLIAGFVAVAVMIGATSLLPLETSAQEKSETEAVLDHHLAAFGNLDLEEILADYTDESIMITPNGVVRGIAELTPVFEGFFEEFGKPGMSFELHTKIVEGEIAYIIWSAETADNVYEFATDTFFVQDGKIMRQTLASKVTPKN